jgi:hypothetical protein
MAEHLDIHAPGPFNVIGENTNLSKSWEQYVKRFEYYLKATGINKDAQKKALSNNKIVSDFCFSLFCFSKQISFIRNVFVSFEIVT